MDVTIPHAAWENPLSEVGFPLVCLSHKHKLGSGTGSSPY